MRAHFVVTRHGRASFVTETELRRTAERGLLAPSELVYHPERAAWVPARELRECRRELAAARTLGQRRVPAPPREVDGEAIAGFILGMLGHLPIVGFVFCLLGLYFSRRALRHDARYHGLALAGLVLSLVFLLPATACGALTLTVYGG